jgi:hypothetical protein
MDKVLPKGRPLSQEERLLQQQGRQLYEMSQSEGWQVFKSFLEEKYGKDYMEQAGLRVYTTLDWDLQQLAEKTYQNGACSEACGESSHVSISPGIPTGGLRAARRHACRFGFHRHRLARLWNPAPSLIRTG